MKTIDSNFAFPAYTYIHKTNTSSYLIFVIFFTRAKFLENKIYTKKTRKLRQNTQKIANFLRYYGKIHSKLPIFRVKSVKIYTGQKKFTRASLVGSWQIWGMLLPTLPCFETSHAFTQRGETFCLQTMQLFLQTVWPSEMAYEKAQWQKERIGSKHVYI